jgi:hypothetical protein
MKKFIFAALLATMACAQAQTDAPVPAQSPTRFLLGVGVSGGGDDLATAQYTNGDTITIHAGRMVYFTAGVDYHFTPEFSLQGTVNYHIDRAPGKNGEVKFERFPIELIGYYQPAPAWRVGGGVRYISNPKLSSSGVLSGMDISFDSTTSAVVEAEYFPRPRLGIKLRYVNETFKARGYQDVDGSHVGLSANFYF